MADWPGLAGWLGLAGLGWACWFGLAGLAGLAELAVLAELAEPAWLAWLAGLIVKFRNHACSGFECFGKFNLSKPFKALKKGTKATVLMKEHSVFKTSGIPIGSYRALRCCA